MPWTPISFQLHGSPYSKFAGRVDEFRFTNFHRFLSFGPTHLHWRGTKSVNYTLPIPILIDYVGSNERCKMPRVHAFSHAWHTCHSSRWYGGEGQDHRTTHAGHEQLPKNVMLQLERNHITKKFRGNKRAERNDAWSMKNCIIRMMIILKSTHTSYEKERHWRTTEMFFKNNIFYDAFFWNASISESLRKCKIHRNLQKNMLGILQVYIQWNLSS